MMADTDVVQMLTAYEGCVEERGECLQHVPNGVKSG